MVDQEQMQDSKNLIEANEIEQYIAWFMIAVSIIIGIVCWKCRRVAECLLYIEFINILLTCCTTPEHLTVSEQSKGYFLSAIA